MRSLAPCSSSAFAQLANPGRWISLDLVKIRNSALGGQADVQWLIGRLATGFRKNPWKNSGFSGQWPMIATVKARHHLARQPSLQFADFL
jgi:hypothetical protein